ncbi:hypothetical protein ACRS6B_13505 [Nocardia asteroides]
MIALVPGARGCRVPRRPRQRVAARYIPRLARTRHDPTVELSMHLRHEPADTPPVLVRTANASTGGGWSVADTSIWDRSGRLLVTARQTRRVLG